MKRDDRSLFDSKLTRRQILLGGLGALGGGVLSTAWGKGLSGLYSGGLNPHNELLPLAMQPMPSGRITRGTLIVGSSPAGKIGSRFAGMSVEKSILATPYFSRDNSDLIGLYARLGISLLRIGGNDVDATHWDPYGRGGASGKVAPADVDALAGFLRETKWKTLYGVNLATSTPEAAASEVSYVVQSLGDSLFGIELGNECNSYGRKKYFPIWDLQIFEDRWETFRKAIMQAAPGVVFTGPGTSGGAGGIANWAVPFGRDVGRQKIALLTQHYYRGGAASPSSTGANLISPDVTLVKDLALLKAGAADIGVPFRITETNSYSGGGKQGVSDSYASALWVIDHLFTIALGGGSGADLHGGGGEAYTPIARNGGTVREVRPEYYGMLLFTLAGQGTLLSTNLSVEGLDATAYAVQALDGSLSLVVINKDATQNVSLSVDCGRVITSASLIAMTAPGLEATSGVQIQGASVGLDGSFHPYPPYSLMRLGSRVFCQIPALSAALIRVR